MIMSMSGNRSVLLFSALEAYRSPYSCHARSGRRRAARSARPAKCGWVLATAQNCVPMEKGTNANTPR